VQPHLSPGLKAVDRILSAPPGCKKAGTRCDSAEWEEFYSTVEISRLLTATPGKWSMFFCRSLLDALPLHERITLPGEWDKVVWVGGDATPFRMGCIDWTHKESTVVDMKHLWPPLEAIFSIAVPEARKGFATADSSWPPLAILKLENQGMMVISQA